MHGKNVNCTEISKYVTFTAVRVLSVNKRKREKVCMRTNDRERVVRKREKHFRHLVLNARYLSTSLAFFLAFISIPLRSSVGNATSLALLRHSLAFTHIRRAGQRTSGFGVYVCRSPFRYIILACVSGCTTKSTQRNEEPPS